MPTDTPITDYSQLPVVLIVDDDPDICVFLARLMEHMAQAPVVHSAEDAFKFMKIKKPDLVLLDDNMPQVRGLFFLEACQKKEEFADIPFVMLTANRLPETIVRAKRGGALDYIVKPIEPNGFLQRMRRLLKAVKSKVLIADDDADVVALLTTKLQPFGVQVLTAADGDTAWRLIEEASPDLVILDRLMPGRDAIQMVKDLMQSDSPRKAHALLLSARDKDIEIMEGLSAGASYYFTKPFDVEKVVDRCARLLGLIEPLPGVKKG